MKTPALIVILSAGAASLALAGCATPPAAPARILDISASAAPAGAPPLCESVGAMACSMAEAAQAGVPLEVVLHGIDTSGLPAELGEVVGRIARMTYAYPAAAADAAEWGRLQALVCYAAVRGGRP